MLHSVTTLHLCWRSSQMLHAKSKAIFHSSEHVHVRHVCNTWHCNSYSCPNLGEKICMTVWCYLTSEYMRVVLDYWPCSCLSILVQSRLQSIPLRDILNNGPWLTNSRWSIMADPGAQGLASFLTLCMYTWQIHCVHVHSILDNKYYIQTIE